MIEKIRKELDKIKTVVSEQDYTLVVDKKDWREFSALINPIIVAGKLGLSLNKLQEIIDLEGNEDDMNNLNFVKDMYNQAFLMSDLSDATTKGKIFDQSGMTAGKGEVKGNVLIVDYSAEDVMEMMVEEDEKRGENWAQELAPQKG